MNILFLMVLLIAAIGNAETVKKMRNPYTGDPDYYTVLSSVTIPSGSTHYAQTNPSSQQAYAISLSCVTAANLYVGMKTLAQLRALTPNTTGQLYYCFDCTTDALCVSTGASLSGFARVSARTTACQ